MESEQVAVRYNEDKKVFYLYDERMLLHKQFHKQLEASG